MRGAYYSEDDLKDKYKLSITLTNLDETDTRTVNYNADLDKTRGYKLITFLSKILYTFRG